MLKATFSGIPVAMTGRGAPMGFADPTDFQIGATNLTANKARFLLMACLLKFGSLPARKIPTNQQARSWTPSARPSPPIRRSLIRTDTPGANDT